MISQAADLQTGRAVGQQQGPGYFLVKFPDLEMKYGFAAKVGAAKAQGCVTVKYLIDSQSSLSVSVQVDGGAHTGLS